MKHKLLVVLQFTVAFAAIAGMLASGSARAEFPMLYLSSGKFASTDFFNNDSNDHSVSGYVQVSDVMYKSDNQSVRPGPMGFLIIRIRTVDDNSYQTGTATFEVTSTRFNISNDLSSAHVEGIGTLNWDQVYSLQIPSETEEVTIDITWTSEDSISSGHNNLRSSYGDIRTHMHSSGTFRYATATGLIKGETFEVEVKPPPPPEPYPTPVPIQTPYLYPAPYPYSFATIGRANYGAIGIYRMR